MVRVKHTMLYLFKATYTQPSPGSFQMFLYSLAAVMLCIPTSHPVAQRAPSQPRWPEVLQPSLALHGLNHLQQDSQPPLGTWERECLR